MFDCTDRRLSHSGIFFRGSEFLAARSLTKLPLAPIALFESRQGLRNALRARYPSGHARWAFHCKPTMGPRHFEIFDLFYKPEQRARGGGLKLWRDASPDRSARHAHLCAKFGKLFFKRAAWFWREAIGKAKNVNQISGAYSKICREIRGGGGGQPAVLDERGDR
ncbi:MAG: hypothetical protein JWL86_189 [Rhizobium sp.]|nr:hypothetical protein [Rhizobium sp.]